MTDDDFFFPGPTFLFLGFKVLCVRFFFSEKKAIDSKKIGRAHV